MAQPTTLDIDSYAAEAELFTGAIDREYYLHFAGHKEGYEIAPIFTRHAGLFERTALEGLRERLARATAADETRRCRYLLQFAVEGFIGQQTKELSTELAELESTLEIELDGSREPYRQAAIVQANEPDPARRLAIEKARDELLRGRLNPLYVEMTEQAQSLSTELGWASYRAMFEELKAIDLETLEGQTRAFKDATDRSYREIVEPQVLAETGIGFDALRRSDLPYFFRANTHDSLFPSERLIEALEQTLAGLGIELRAQSNVKLDLEHRPRKSARAFCAPVHVPNEIYLVIPRKGGRDDYAALFHEAGHTEHYAAVDPKLPFEFRHLGDNSVTEGFAFLFDHLTEDANWLRGVLGAEVTDRYLEYVRANNLIFLRRYTAKLRYELELHGGQRPLEEMPDLYAALLGAAVGVDWPTVTYLADVDDGYYVANYLRAWALQASLRRILRERFGEDWFARSEAGDYLRSIWREGQRLTADELITELGAGPLDFTIMLEEI